MLARALLVLCVAASAACATAAPQPERRRPLFVYDDVDRFAAALRAIDDGAAPEAAFATYIAGASAAFPFYAERYGVTAQSLAAAVARRPRHYRRVAGLRPALERFEDAIARGIARLGEIAPGNDPPPIHYLVAKLTAGGSPSELRPRPPSGPPVGVAIAVETVARVPETDMSEFPGPYGAAYLRDIPYVAVHETVHVYQARLQGLDNYRSIYLPGPNNINLALALREGCADYVTFLVAGVRRTGDQQVYGLAHERELWRQFREIMHRPASFDDGWFGPLDARTPDWPPQIGYWLGMRMCEAHHREAADPAQAMREILGAYSAADMDRIAAAYIRRMGD